MPISCALHRAAGALLILTPVVMLAVMAYQHRWMTEDAFIDVRVVQHLLAGYGPVFNVGERVEAYTSSLWVALLALWGGLTRQPIEVGAVILGVLCSAGGVLAAQAGALALAQRLWHPHEKQSRQWVAVPLGATVVAALPPMWDFATSGLETGLIFGWLGLSYWLLGRAVLPRSARTAANLETLGRSAPSQSIAAMVVGLGPLIRPDLTLFSVAFLLVLLLQPVHTLRHRRCGIGGAGLRLILAAGALPLAYQLFRMGYFATLVPYPALAKEAGLANWSQGWRYAADFVQPYRLQLPLALLLAWWGISIGRAGRCRDWARLMLLTMPVAAGLLHALYVIRIGGDFMHGRFLLPGLFGLCLPVAATWLPVPVRGARAAHAGWLAATLVLAWAVVCALWLRIPYISQINPYGIADERGWYIRQSRHPHPITAADYAHMAFAVDGRTLRARLGAAPDANAGPAGPYYRVLLLDTGDEEYSRLPPHLMMTFPLRPDVHPTILLVTERWNIGLAGVVAGPHVHFVDRRGLTDPLAARLRLVKRARPGHEKSLPNAWIMARFVDPQQAPALTASVAAARHALACGDLAELLRAVEEPLTLQRFVANIHLSWRLTRLRFAADPAVAAAELCRGA
jgi:arabinofuranosyltransferase